jgi:hypothetical protein
MSPNAKLAAERTGNALNLSSNNRATVMAEWWATEKFSENEMCYVVVSDFSRIALHDLEPRD